MEPASCRLSTVENSLQIKGKSLPRRCSLGFAIYGCLDGYMEYSRCNGAVKEVHWASPSCYAQ